MTPGIFSAPSGSGIHYSTRGVDYREHQGEFSLTSHMGLDEVVERMRALLLCHRTAVRVRDLDQAAFLVARGLSAIVRRALEEQPAKLGERAFRDELVDLAVLYVTAERPPQAENAQSRLLIRWDRI